MVNTLRFKNQWQRANVVIVDLVSGQMVDVKINIAIIVVAMGPQTDKKKAFVT
jgi:hypothetical protein